MKIVIASDHAGFTYKNQLITFLKNKGYNLDDLGAFEPDSNDDYPDYATKASLAIQQGRYERGILICGSGVGVSVAANKYKGIRAAVCHDSYSAHQGVEHDNMNLLCIGSRIIGTELLFELAEIFLKATFSNAERHIRRINKIKDIETGNFR